MTLAATHERRPRSGRRLGARRSPLLDTEWVVRFNVSQRLQHLVLAVSFVGLVITGLPQKYTDWPLATWTINQLGGIDSARLIHRSFAVAFVLLALYHVLEIGFMAVRGRLRPTMVPNLKDVFDALTMLRYSLGLASTPPRFDRYEYRQKFEYWGIVFGTTIMITTGLTLWFPIVVTKVLPGEFVAAAREAHGSEATLALLTIVTWHLYSVVLSPAAFPGDLSIFTGRISRERMKEEHPLEYRRLVDEAVGKQGVSAGSRASPKRPRRLSRRRSAHSHRVTTDEEHPR
jgi:formate dehydrogenase subunit gamma